MWFREAFNDQINPAWQNVHLDQLDQVCIKIEKVVAPNKTATRPKAHASSPPSGAKQQLYYQSMQSFFDTDEEAPETFLSFSQTLLNNHSTIPNEQTSLLNTNNNQNENGDNHTIKTTTLTSSPNFSSTSTATASSLTLRAYLQRENSLALLHTAATPFSSLSPELQKLETFYSALFLAEIDQTNSFFKTMQSRVQGELIFLFAKCCDVLKAKKHIHTPQQLNTFLADPINKDHVLPRTYKLMAHFIDIMTFFDQPIPIRLTSQSSPNEIGYQLGQFICDYAISDKNVTIHSRTNSPASPGFVLNDQNDINNNNNNNVKTTSNRSNPLHNFPPPQLPTNNTTNNNNNTNNTNNYQKESSESMISEDMSLIEVSFRELSRCLHLLTPYTKLNRSALLHSLETHDQTGTPLKLYHQMSVQVNKSPLGLHGARWCRALIAILVELYALFFAIQDKKRAWKLLKSQAVVDTISEPKTATITAYFLASTFCTSLILLLLYQYPHLHPWLLSILPLWRFSSFIVVLLLCLAGLVFFCIKTNINYIFLLNLKPMTAYTHKSILYHAGMLWSITTACMLLLIGFKLYDVHSLTWLPHTVLTASFGYYFYLNWSYISSSLKQFIICAPNFQSSFIGDQLCSLTRLMGDILYIIIFYVHCLLNLHKNSSLEHAKQTIASTLHDVTSPSSTTTGDDIHSGSIITNIADSAAHSAFLDQTLSMELQLEVRGIVKQFMWFITVTPFILRAIQCLRSYYHLNNFNPRHLGNTAKYLVAIIMSTFALLYKQALSFAPKLASAAAAATTAATVVTNANGSDTSIQSGTKSADTLSSIVFPSFFSLFSLSGTNDQTTQASIGNAITNQITTTPTVATTTTAIIDQNIFEVYQIWLSQLQYIFLISAIITTLFQLIWDFSVDWGLFENGPYFPFRKKTIFKKNALKSIKSTPHNPNFIKSKQNDNNNNTTDDDDHIQRQPLTSPTTTTTRLSQKQLNNKIKYIYSTAMILNTIMRLFWIETLLPWNSLGIFSGSAYSSFFSTDLAVFILGIIEIIRRNIWAYFRLENSQVNNNAEYHPIHFKIPEINSQQFLTPLSTNNNNNSNDNNNNDSTSQTPFSSASTSSNDSSIIDPNILISRKTSSLLAGNDIKHNLYHNTNTSSIFYPNNNNNTNTTTTTSTSTNKLNNTHKLKPEQLHSLPQIIEPIDSSSSTIDTTHHDGDMSEVEPIDLSRIL